MRKGFLIVLVTILVTATLATPALAKKAVSELPTEGVMSSDPMHGSSEDTQVNATGGLILKWGCDITNKGNGTVDIHGYTNTGITADSIKVTVYLQKWTGSNWVDVTGIANTAYNTTYVSTYKNLTITKGYYYRTRGVHTATNGTNTETIYSTSSYIWVD